MVYIIGTFTEAVAATIDPDVHVIRTSGRLTENDGGAATYQRTTSALDGSQQNYSWFQAADGSVWQLSDGQPYYAAQFGALGGDQIDSRPIIQAALDAPMVGVLNLGPLVHWFSGNIQKPSGKGLVGAGRGISGFRSFQITVQQTSPRYGIYCDGDKNGWFADFFINIDRAGLNFGATPVAQLLNRCSGLVIRGDSQSVRVDRIDVYNATGYAHYTAAGDGGTPGQRQKTSCAGIARRITAKCVLKPRVSAPKKKLSTVQRGARLRTAVRPFPWKPPITPMAGSRASSGVAAASMATPLAI
ncbi:hypothetical protein QP178_19990 [Sphingomonas aurantiaca]|uniref:hypothetical protein n=1 Tax=Sphingomonas aurantiaca TaxID=185949 RepID=UPI002FE1D956